MVKIPTFRSTGFALLDIGYGRHKLAEYFSERVPRRGVYGTVPKNKPIKILIEAEVCDQWGGDDGVSIEFVATVKKITVLDNA